MYTPGSAGHSALKQAGRLLQKQVVDVSKWAGSAWGVGGVGFLLAPGSLSVVSLVAGGAAGVTLAVWRWRKPSTWRRWLQGALAERRVGRVLNQLRREGWGVLHDRRVPRSRANLDHVLIHPSGRFLVYVDTKAWHAAKAVIRVTGGRLMYGPWPQGDKADTVRWEANRLNQKIGLDVVPVIAVDRGKVNGDHLIFRGVHVVNADMLLDVLDGLRPMPLPNRDRVRQITRNIEREFVVAR